MVAEKEILGIRSKASDEIGKKLRSIPGRDYYSVLGDFFEVSAVVRLGDALSMKYSRAWFTPAYIFNWPHFKRELEGLGSTYPTTPTVRECHSKAEKQGLECS